jgi:hypothetical protein
MSVERKVDSIVELNQKREEQEKQEALLLLLADFFGLHENE